MKKLILSLFILLASALTASVSARSTVYTGTIGTYKIHMVLDEKYEGYYYYDHRPQSHFKLVKTRLLECDDDCIGVHVTLQEYAPGTNKNTGEFVGTFCHGFEAGISLITFEGTFRNKTTGKTLPFVLYHASQYYNIEIE
jgi:hypothetical protein